MARLFFSLPITKTPGADPETLAQLVAATNQRLIVRAVELISAGATGATAPLVFDWVTQADAGTGSSASGDFTKDLPAASETIQATAQKAFTVEPGSPVVKAKFSMHQQASRLWVPPFAGGELIIPGGTRAGLRIHGNPSFEIQLMIHLEE